MSSGIKISNLTCSLSQNGSEIIPLVGKGVTKHASLSTAVLGTLQYNDLSANKIITNPFSNKSSGLNSSVLGGKNNNASGVESVIIGGNFNNAEKNGSVVIGGGFNNNDGEKSIIIGGCNNIVQDLDPEIYDSIIIGGCSNTVSHSASIIIGGNNISTGEPNFTYVENISAVERVAGNTFLSGGTNLIDIFNTDPSIDLQDVTDNGNTTTNGLSVASLSTVGDILSGGDNLVDLFGGKGTFTKSVTTFDAIFDIRNGLVNNVSDIVYFVTEREQEFYIGTEDYERLGGIN